MCFYTFWLEYKEKMKNRILSIFQISCFPEKYLQAILADEMT